jgi:hypothetical protein
LWISTLFHYIEEVPFALFSASCALPLHHLLLSASPGSLLFVLALGSSRNRKDMLEAQLRQSLCCSISKFLLMGKNRQLRRKKSYLATDLSLPLPPL